MEIDICLGTVNLLTERGGQPIFYMRVGRLMRLATKIVKATGVVTRNIKFVWTKCASRYKLVNGENVTYHGIFYYLQSGKPNSFSPLRIFANGPAVKLVATGSWRKWFLLSCLGGQDLSCYDKAVLV